MYKQADQFVSEASAKDNMKLRYENGKFFLRKSLVCGDIFPIENFAQCTVSEVGIIVVQVRKQDPFFPEQIPGYIRENGIGVVQCRRGDR
jgi:hypothetical protein